MLTYTQNYENTHIHKHIPLQIFTPEPEILHSFTPSSQRTGTTNIKLPSLPPPNTHHTHMVSETIDYHHTLISLHK